MNAEISVHRDFPIGDVTNLGELSLVEWIELANPDLKAVNTAEDPERVAPVSRSGAELHDGRLRLKLSPASWNMIRLVKEN